MNRKQFLILLVLVVLVGAAGLVIRQRGQSSWQQAGQALGQKLLPDLAVNDVTQISIKSGTNQLNLVRRDDRWRVREREDYPANFSQISEMLLKFADLKIVQSQEVGASQLGRFELLPPGAEKNSGTQVELKDQGGKSLGTVLLGKRHMSKPGDEGWPDGRYVMAGVGSKSLAVISDPLENVQPQPEQWLDKEFVKIENPRSVSVQFAEQTNSWKLTRASTTNDWQLDDAKAGEHLDMAKAAGVTSPFSSASFQDVSPLTSGSATNGTVLTVETFDGFAYIATINPQENGNYPVHFAVSASIPAERAAGQDEKPEDKARLDKEFKDHQTKLNEKLAREKQFAQRVYHLPAYTVDPWIKHRADLLVEAKPESASKE